MARVYSAHNLPNPIPLFPLEGALLLPRARLPLHIFEPRYLTMLDDVLKSDHRLIGMVQPADDHGGLCDIGCAGRLTKFTEQDDGRYSIALSGVSRFKILTAEDGFTPYRVGHVDWSEFTHDLTGAEHDAGLDRDALLALLARYFEHEDLKTNWEALKKAEDEALVNSLSMLCPFDPADKQALLSASTLGERRSMLMTLLEFATRGGKSEDRLQ